jgi:hypothetical protein
MCGYIAPQSTWRGRTACLFQKRKAASILPHSEHGQVGRHFWDSGLGLPDLLFGRVRVLKGVLSLPAVREGVHFPPAALNEGRRGGGGVGGFGHFWIQE